ncbi:HNH endonuclease family protein, partial [Mycolicibacterium elephantis]
PVVPQRVRGHDYRRAAFGESWTDDTTAPGGHNGCDTRNDVLDRDLADKTYVSIKRCPTAVATGTLYDPYTNAVVAFTRGAGVGASVQIDHLVPLALAWDLGARGWPEEMRVRFANDPANLLAVAGEPNQDKGDQEPADWMPPNRAFHCQYAMQFIEVLRGYRLPIDAPSATVLRDAAATCPSG